MTPQNKKRIELAAFDNQTSRHATLSQKLEKSGNKYKIHTEIHNYTFWNFLIKVTLKSRYLEYSMINQAIASETVSYMHLKTLMLRQFKV